MSALELMEHLQSLIDEMPSHSRFAILLPDGQWHDDIVGVTVSSKKGEDEFVLHTLDGGRIVGPGESLLAIRYIPAEGTASDIEPSKQTQKMIKENSKINNEASAETTPRR